MKIEGAMIFGEIQLVILSKTPKEGNPTLGVHSKFSVAWISGMGLVLLLWADWVDLGKFLASQFFLHGV